MAKPKMELQWHNERAQPIERDEAARIIRGNRRKMRGNNYQRVKVFRRCRETYIVSDLLGVGCCIGRT